MMPSMQGSLVHSSTPVSQCVGCPSGPVVMSGAVTELVVAVPEPGRESLVGVPPSLGVGVEAGGRELGVELGLG